MNQEPHARSSGQTEKSENGYLTGYHEDENSQNQVPKWEAFLVGSSLRPEHFGFGHPLASMGKLGELSKFLEYSRYIMQRHFTPESLRREPREFRGQTLFI